MFIAHTRVIVVFQIGSIGVLSAFAVISCLSGGKCSKCNILPESCKIDWEWITLREWYSCHFSLLAVLTDYNDCKKIEIIYMSSLIFINFTKKWKLQEKPSAV